MRSSILILMSDTGGGHRAAAEAIRDAVQHAYAHQYTVAVEDLFKQARWPATMLPGLYSPVIKYGHLLYAFGFRFTDGRRWASLIARVMDPFLSPALRKLYARHDPALVICVHPLMTGSACRLLRKTRPAARFVTVVTDLADAHALWFFPGADLTSVPTPEAAQRARRYRIPSHKVRVLGQPISLKFSADACSPSEYRERLGLRQDLPVVLLVGGGEGMGKLRPIAQAISDAQLPVQLVVIAGRNEKLRRDLEARPWKIPVKVNDFVTNMPEWMRAADVIVTKAGPGTVIEAVATGLPILLSGYVHGQENGNVAFVEQNGLGVLRESPRAIVAQLREWLTPGNPALAEMQARARALAHPHAAQDIAVALDEQIRASSAAVDLPARRLRVVTTAVARAKQVWSVHFSLPPAAFLPRMRRGVEAAKRYLGR